MTNLNRGLLTLAALATGLYTGCSDDSSGDSQNNTTDLDATGGATTTAGDPSASGAAGVVGASAGDSQGGGGAAPSESSGGSPQGGGSTGGAGGDLGETDPSDSEQGGAGGSAGTEGESGAGGEMAGADTWDSFAMGFFVTYCASCHNDDNAGDASRDYHVLANVQAEMAEIACGVAKSEEDWSARGCNGSPPANQFPVGNGPMPTDEERDRLLAWIDAGTP